MAEYQKTIITNAGISVLNRVLSGKATATFTRAVSSTDDLSSKTESELRAMTGFGSVMQNGVCSRYDIHSSNMVSLDLLFTNENLGNSYMINTVGLYAKASDSSTEVLYAIARAGKDDKGNSLAEQMPAYAGSLTQFTISLYTQVGQASGVNVSITDEGVVKSINGSLNPDVSGDVTIDDSSHAKFIEAELINGHLLVPLVDDSGSPITDPVGNQLVADEYLPKSIKLGNHQEIYPGTDNTVKLPVYTQAEVDAKLSAKADTPSGIISFIAKGIAISRLLNCGKAAKAHMPIMAGKKAKPNCTKAFIAVPIRTVFSSRAPYTLPIRPGEMQKAGTNIIR